MDWDHLAEQQGQKYFAGWLRMLFKDVPALPLKLAKQLRPGNAEAIEVSPFAIGAFNICYTVTFDDGFRVCVRFPIFGRSRFRTEKTMNEISVMRFLSQETKIPVPFILGAGNWGLGPYIVMTFIEGTLLSKCIKGSPSTDPTISGSEIQNALCAMADIVLELSKISFPSIGSLAQESGTWKVANRPLTLNMNELVRVGNVPPNVFSKKVFRTACEYYQDLATQQFLHLAYQQNDAVDGEQDCRKKYIARCLFRKIAGQVSVAQTGPFRLYCDDLRPSNVLVSEEDFEITGIIDWEYTYVAPVEFTYAALSWLLFESPESWESDLNGFLVRFTPRLQVFLDILRSREERQIQNKEMDESQRLSDKMADSMENGMFWFCLAAKKSFMCDEIYWTFLDRKYFGDGTVDDRLELLSQDEWDDLERIVPLKMQQASKGVLQNHLTYNEFVDL